MLNWRRNNTFNKKEDFTYDKLNRLLTEALNGVLTNEYTYDKRGRITSNTELGKYNYNENNYKLQSIDFNTNGQNVKSQRGFAAVTYNAFKSPLRIQLAGKEDLTFEYNILKTRYSMTSAVTGQQKLYSSDFAVEISKENNGKTQIITYITGDPYSANYIKKEILDNGAVTENANYFLHRDNLGSILAITKTDGSFVEKRFFDAWGNLKGLVNETGQLITDAVALSNYKPFLDRGYTGHEHLWKAGLINMNARLYDPILRKFLSPDNLIPDPFNTQSYDRFGYVYNNPLLYVDIDGNEPISFTVAVVIGVAVALTTKVIFNMISGIPVWYGLGKTAVMGAISSVISLGIGSIATSSFGQAVTIGKGLFEAGAHALTSGTMSALDGGKFVAGALSGAVSSALSSAIQALGTDFAATKAAGRVIYNGFGRDYMKAAMIATGGLSGGISSTIAGGNFWDGFRQGIITSGLNHASHLGAEALQKDRSDKVYDSDGDYVGKIKVNKYESYHDLQSGEDGLHIEVQFNNESKKYSNFEWVQTVGTNDPDGGSGEYTTYLDRTHKYGNSSPFYYHKEDYVTYGSQIKDGNKYVFTDSPTRSKPTTNVGWRAELSLVGINSSGAYHLYTMTYGFNYYSYGHLLLMPLISRESTNRYWWLKK